MCDRFGRLLQATLDPPSRRRPESPCVNHYHDLDNHLPASRRVDATIIERIKRRYEIRGDRGCHATNAAAESCSTVNG